MKKIILIGFIFVLLIFIISCATQIEKPIEKTVQETKETIKPPTEIIMLNQTCQPDPRYKLCADLSKELVIQPENCRPLPSQVTSFIEQCKSEYEPAGMLSYTKDEIGCIVECCTCGPFKIMEKEVIIEPSITQPQNLTKEEIELVLDSVQDEVKTYLISWYNEFYPILKNTTGGPCQPFKANVAYFPAGSGGTFKASGLGQDAALIFNMPLDKSKAYDANFDSRFGHEFTHGFLNGIRVVGITPSGGMVTASFITEGSTEMIIQATLLEQIKKGKTDYKTLGHYLPYQIASYDAYAVQGKNIAGGLLMWKGDGTGWYYNQGQVVWYLLEQAKPGFVNQFFKEACSLPQTKERGWTGIYLTHNNFKNILQKIFAGTKIEGENILDWFNAQPVTDINVEAGNFMRIQFRDKDTNKAGRSINPASFLITAVNRIVSPGEGPIDSGISSTPTVKITDWQGKITDVQAKSGVVASAILPTLPSGAYKVEVSDSSLDAKTTTYFVVTDTADEDSLYGIRLENRKIVASGVVKSSLGDVQINKGVFVLKVPADVNEVNFPEVGRTVIKPVGMARMIILS